MKKPFWQRPLIWVFLFQIYALVLVWLAFRAGIHTDEAKYLLNIPYPHPPVLRTALGWMDGWVWQEVFVRAAFASVLVHAVWFLWDLMRKRKQTERLSIMFAYLASAAVLSQAGTVMFATITAVQLLMWYWLSARLQKGQPGLLGLLWLLTVLSTFQGVLMAPLAWVCIYRSTKSFWKSSVIVIVPVVLLLLYALSNPFVLAAFASHGSSTPALADKLWQTAKLWMVGGSVAMSVLGTVVLVRSQERPLQATALLIAAYAFMAPQPHYALFFTAVFFAALAKTLLSQQLTLALAVLTPLLTVFLLQQFALLPQSTAARGAITHIVREIPPGPGWLLQMAGPFGHEWQYESPWPVVPYNESLWPQTAAIVCTGNDCASLPSTVIPVYRITNKKEAERLHP